MKNWVDLGTKIGFLRLVLVLGCCFSASSCCLLFSKNLLCALLFWLPCFFTFFIFLKIMSELALARIRENIEKHRRGEDASELDLSGCDISIMPWTLYACVWLESLIIGNNPKLKDLSLLTYLTNLVGLDCSSTHARDLFPISKLSKLQILLCNNTEINDLSPIAKLTQIQILACYSTQVIDLSPLANLSKLQILSCYKTHINDLTPIAQLPFLQKLYCSSTLVEDLSPLRKLTNLQELDCHSTQVNDLSPLANLPNLKILDCRSTQIRDLLPLKSILIKGIDVISNDWDGGGNGIYIKGCPLNNPPIEIATRGKYAILNYWKKIEAQGVETIDEGKLIIVGEGKTGKTTLYNKLINPKYNVLANPTDETHGINTHEGFEIIPELRANLWDFGGQEMQYMTHQFFLTPRALYVLVMDARAEAPNLPYWFRIISLLGKHSAGERVSLLLVLNKRKGSTGRPQYEDLLKIYADDFDVEFFEVDLAENDERWAALHAAIIRRLADLPIVKNLLPKQWHSIRESLRTESEKRAHIPTDRLDEICRLHQVVDEAEQWQMTDYLHQLGSLLHFQNDEDLMTTVFLQSRWAVEGVYTTLRSDDIKNSNGRFTSNKIFQILREGGYSKTDSQKILKLMSKNNFDICYPARNGAHFVAAQLLPVDRPVQFRWHPTVGALQFRYQYSIMPKGLMSRLIVRLSEYLEVVEGCEIVWKKGAVLEMQPVENSHCRLLMFEDEDSKSGLKQIAVEVMEADEPFRNRRFALQRVRDEVADLHRRWFPNIQFEQIIPCNCEQCRASASPFTFLLSDLKKLKKGRAYCNALEDFVPLQQLLEGVFLPEEIRRFELEGRAWR